MRKIRDSFRHSTKKMEEKRAIEPRIMTEKQFHSLINKIIIHDSSYQVQLEFDERNWMTNYSNISLHQKTKLNILVMHRRITFHTAFPLAVPTKHGWCEQSIIRKKVLGLVARTSGAITSKALTKTSTDGTKGTWVSNEVSVSLWIM